MKFYDRASLAFVGSQMWLRSCSSFTANPIQRRLEGKSLPKSFDRSYQHSSQAASTLESSKMDQSFTTWSFDKPCETMEWNEIISIDLSVSKYDKQEVDDSDLVLVGIFAPPKGETDDEEKEEEDKSAIKLSGIASDIDQELGGALVDIMFENYKEFKNGATAGSTTPTLRLITPNGKTQRYMMFGMGPTPKDDDDKKKSETLGFTLGKAIASRCKGEKKITSCSVVFPESFATDSEKVMSDITSSFYSTLYSDNRFRTGDRVEKVVEELQSVALLCEEASVVLPKVLEDGKKVAQGIFLAKDIVNSPHNVLNSHSLADTAKRIAEESNGRMECTILGKEECEERGMGAFLGVARGSETEPQFFHLKYTPADGKIKKKVGIVGKGLLFDTGGYNIKTASMELMKFDCGGSAAVLGAARSVAAIAPSGVEAHFIVAACENMINDKAVVPSDILTASNGKTIEVLNTDAEGRLTLADALVYADKELDCESIIELSTLTGACMISLGQEIAGVWTDNDDLAKELEEISMSTGDSSWRMPMAKEYNKELKSKIADLKNIGGRYGGAITAALFLQNFVSKKKPFAHIDIAGPVWSDSIGATGFGSKMVTEWVQRQGK